MIKGDARSSYYGGTKTQEVGMVNTSSLHLVLSLLV